MRTLIVFFVLTASLAAQTAPGVAPAWDLRAMLRTLADNTLRYQDSVANLNIADWVSKGAPDAYQRQQQVVLNEIGYLRSTSTRLADDPERLSLVVDAIFRLETLEALTASLSDAASRYQEGDTSRTLSDLLNQNADARSRLRRYLLDLSQTKEQEQAIALKEAQRCQAVLNHNPLATPTLPPRRPAVKK